MNESATATLFMDGDSQAVRLPDDFRLPGTQVRVSRSGRGVLLEPVAVPGEVQALLDKLKRLARTEGPFMPEGREQPPMPPDDHIDLDR